MDIGLTLFGAPTITRGDTSGALEFERRGQVLAFLALKRAWVGRAELAALLWPELESKLAFANVRKALFRLQSMPWAERLESNGSALRFDVATDVAAFEAALRERRLADALALRRGELLAGFDDLSNEAWSSWLGFERDRLRVAWRGAAQELLAGELEAPAAVDLAARLFDDDPLDESALGIYMTWLARSGQGVRARQAYRDFAARLAQELGLTPSAELTALHDSIGTAPLHAAGTPAKPVPSDDGFVGRTVELRRIAALLAEEPCRLLTVIGPGGVGKTSLVRRAMQEVAASFADGAVFVALEDAASTAEMAGRLAHELGVKAKGSADPLEPVLAHLRERQALLVLDNFEQLADSARALEGLLAQCPGVKLIVTSRVRLGLAAEWLLPLDGMPCPEEEDRDRLEAFDAARLFVRAARRVAPALVPSIEAQAIVDICRQVEGLPLALELAAAWTRVLSCDAIAAELKRGTDLLQAVDASQPARHASIERVFDQSWRLLTPVEREALARLSVFRGGFTAEAARAVARAPLPVLAALADKSLLRKEGARLQLHPLVQQFASARLAAGRDGDQTHDAHAAYFHGRLYQLKRAVGDGERDALHALDDDFDNCRRAWLWSVTQRQADALARSLPVLIDYCDYRGRIEEALQLLRHAVEAPVAQEIRLQGLLISKIAHLEYRLDRYDDAETDARRALVAARRSRDRATRVQATNVLATCAFRRGRYADARRYFKQTLELVEPAFAEHARAAALDHLALIEKQMGQYDEALRLSLQSLAEHRRIGDSAGVALCLNNLGSLHLAMNRHEAAAGYLREGLAICERDGLVSAAAYIHGNLVDALLPLGQYAEARRHGERAIELASSAGNRTVVGAARLSLVRVELARGAAADARAALSAGLALATAVGLPWLKYDGLIAFAELLHAEGETVPALQVLSFVATQPATPRPLVEVAAARRAAWQDGKPAAAWPGLELDELVRRIVAETGVAHAPLIGALRGAS